MLAYRQLNSLASNYKTEKKKLCHQVKETADNLPLFQIGLSVQCGSFYVAQAVRIAGAEQQNVGRQDFITSQPDEVSHPRLLPVLLHIAPLRSAK